MGEVKKRTIRVKLDTSLSLPRTLSIESWRGNALDIQVGIYDSDGVSSISDIDSINVKVQESQTNTTTLMDSTVTSGDLDATLDATSWNDGSKQHATFSFSNVETNLTLVSPKKVCWIVFSAILTGGEIVTLGAGSFTLHEDNGVAAV